MSNLIPLHSNEGQKLLADVKSGCGLFQPIIHHIFKKQIGEKNCGIQSCAMLLAAHEIGSRLTDIKQGDMVTDSESKYDEMSLLGMPETHQVADKKRIEEESGLDLLAVHDILKAHGMNTSIHYASDVTEDTFRQQAKGILARRNSSAGIIVNYHMATLGQSPAYGHHSPLAGYHPQTDRFLLLDVWKETVECWTRTADLYEAMNTIDDASHKSRGYVIIH